MKLDLIPNETETASSKHCKMERKMDFILIRKVIENRPDNLSSG